MFFTLGTMKLTEKSHYVLHHPQKIQKKTKQKKKQAQ